VAKLFEKSGLDMASQDTDILKVRTAFESGTVEPEDVVEMARDVVEARRGKSPAPEVSIEDIKKEAEKDALEKLKQSANLKVDPGSPAGATLSDDDFIKKYSEGALNEPKDHKRARGITDKLIKGG